jgi:hypothetical protein
MRSRENLAWVAGLFEGEGSFTLIQTGPYPVIRAKVSMTDKDVVEKIYAIVGFGSFFEARQTNPLHQLQWQWQTASFEGFQAFAAMVWPWLCSRRRLKVIEIFTFMKSYYQARKRPSMGKTLLLSGSIKNVG